MCKFVTGIKTSDSKSAASRPAKVGIKKLSMSLPSSTAPAVGPCSVGLDVNKLSSKLSSIAVTENGNKISVSGPSKESNCESNVYHINLAGASNLTLNFG